MIDVNELRENPEKFRASQRARQADESLVDAIIAADAARRDSRTRFENLRAEQNAFGKRVAKAKGEEKQALLAEVKELAGAVKAAGAEADAAQAESDALLRRIPNLVQDGVPAGGEDDFEVIKTVGKPRDFAAEGFKSFDVMYRERKIRCMFYGECPGADMDEFLYRNTDLVQINDITVPVQSLEFYYKNAEKDTAHYKMVEEWINERVQ